MGIFIQKLLWCWDIQKYVSTTTAPSTGNIRHISVHRQRLRNRLARLNLPQRKESLPSLLKSQRDRQSSLSLTLSPDNRRLSFLLGLTFTLNVRSTSVQYLLTFSTINLARSASTTHS